VQADPALTWAEQVVLAVVVLQNNPTLQSNVVLQASLAAAPVQTPFVQTLLKRQRLLLSHFSPGYLVGKGVTVGAVQV